MNHTRFPKEDHLPDWARRDNQGKKGDRLDTERGEGGGGGPHSRSGRFR